MADIKPEPKKKRAPKTGKRVTITLSDDHFDAISKAAAADDREPNVYLSRIVRQHLNSTIAKA
jgi:hypothetical protein